MGYRLPDERGHDHRQHINDVARQSVISVDNGVISRFVIPMFYEEHHDKMLHDHLGWPSPGHPDHSCQLPPGQEFVLNGIDLVDEGYTSVEVVMIEPPDGLSFTGVVGRELVSLTIEAMCQDAIDSDVEVSFAIYVTGLIQNDYDEEDLQLRDLVTKGVLHIVAGPIASVEPDDVEPDEEEGE